jgi:hypothetical protein
VNAFVSMHERVLLYVGVVQPSVVFVLKHSFSMAL